MLDETLRITNIVSSFDNKRSSSNEYDADYMIIEMRIKMLKGVL